MTSPTITYYAAFDGSTWDDITADVLGGCSVSSGMHSTAPMDRIADVGELSFTLNNSESNSVGLAGYYSPGHTNCRSGFAVGLKVKITFAFAGIVRTKFYGSIPEDGIKPVAGKYRDRKTTVTVHDYMRDLLDYEIQQPSLMEDVRADQIIDAIVSQMPKAPLFTEYNAGVKTFEVAFDTVSSRSTAINESQKIIQSEAGGYLFVKHAAEKDEVLCFEGKGFRAGKTVLEIIVDTDQSDYLTDEAGRYLTDEAGNRLKRDQTTAINWSDTMSGLETSTGRHIYNRIVGTAYPKRIDSTSVVLASIASPVEIAAGATVEMWLYYSDPSGKASSATGKNMVDPVASTDYLMNTLSDGTGTDTTSDLSVTATYFANSVKYSLTNNNAATGFVTKLQARGQGIYSDSSVTSTAEDSASISAYRPHVLNLSQPYEVNINNTASDVAAILALYKDPVTAADTVTIPANKSFELLAAFVQAEIGDKIQISETQTGINAEYFINGIDFQVTATGVVGFTWTVKPASLE